MRSPAWRSWRRDQILRPQWRKSQREAGAAGTPVLHGNGCGVQLGDALDDGKAKPRAPLFSAVAPPEPLKDQLAFVFVHALPVIDNAYRSDRLDDRIECRSLR